MNPDSNTLYSTEDKTPITFQKTNFFSEIRVCSDAPFQKSLASFYSFFFIYSYLLFYVIIVEKNYG